MDQLLKALKSSGEPTRLRLLYLLSQSELTVSEIVAVMNQSQPRISRHLKLLVESGLLERYQEGSWVFHRLAQHTPVARSLVHLIQQSDDSDRTMARDTERLEEVKAESHTQANAYFEKYAKDWDQLRAMIGSEVSIENAILHTVAKARPERLIDLGTGTGRILELCAPYINEGIGYDLNLKMLAVARDNLSRADISNCQVRLQDIHALPADINSVSCVTLHQVLHYLDKPQRIVTEACRVLKPGGLLLIADYAQHQHEFLRKEHQHRRLGFTDDEVNQWCTGLPLELTNTQTVTQNNTETGLNVVLWSLIKTDA